MKVLAIVGGTGLDQLESLEDRREQSMVTPWGPPSGPLVFGRIDHAPLVFLARHGHEHSIPPHEVNYRANLWALRESGVEAVIGVAAVGGIMDCPAPGGIAVPDQLIDYTHGRAVTYFEGPDAPVEHIDFTHPYSEDLRQALLAAAGRADVAIHDGGCYGATQGPRLETAAEIRRMERDGCTLVGMTGMPEAALARELGLRYACCAVVANHAAGNGEEPISLESIKRNLEHGMADVRALLPHLTAALASQRD